MKIATESGFISFEGKRLLHFAPEASVRRLIAAQHPNLYDTADILEGIASLKLDLEEIDVPDGTYEVVICSHVLEHVNDNKAIPELYRVLSPGGQLVVMVPIIEGWPTTYEDSSIVAPRERALHFGQADHVRYYGADFRLRLSAAGFKVAEYTALGVESVRYGLTRGEKVFRGTKSYNGA